MNTEDDTTGTTNCEHDEATPEKSSDDAHQFSGFAAPFQVLVLTERDCDTQLKELGITAVTLAVDIRSLNSETVKACAPFKDLRNIDDHYLATAHEITAKRMSNDASRKGYWALVACRAALDCFKVFQAERNHELNASAVRLALFAQNMMNIAWRPKRMSEIEHIADNALTFANHFAGKEKANKVQLKTAQETQAKARSEKAKAARELATSTLYPEWQKSNANEAAMVGYRHCARILTQQGYKNANGAAITSTTVKAYFKKPKTAKYPV